MCKANIKWFFIALFFVSLPLTYSAPVTDLNLYLVNPPAEIYKDLNFGLTWTGDANVLHLKVDTDANQTIYSDVNFGSQTLTYIEMGGADGRISTPVSFDLTTSYVEWNFIVDLNETGNNFVIVAGEGTTYNLNTEPGYDFFVDTSGKPYFRFHDGAGNNTTLISGSNGDVPTLTSTAIKITRSAAGLWELFVGGVSKGTDTNTSFTAMESFWLDYRKQDSSLTNLTIGTTIGGRELFYVGAWTEQAGDWNVSTFNTFKQVTSPYYFSKTFNSGGTKNIYATLQNPDGNASELLQLEIASDTTAPTLILTDFNYTNVFQINTIDFNANYGIGCLDESSPTVDVNITNNDVNILAKNITNDTNTYLIAGPLYVGQNKIVYSCSDKSGNVSTVTAYKKVGTGNFYFVYDKTGVKLTGATDYTLADINSIVVYSLDDNTSIDLFTPGAVSFYFVGDSNTSLDIRIAYNDITILTTSRSFDLDVLDVNSVPVCFYKLEPYYEQLLYSSVERDVKIVNANNGCYHVAATTRYGASDYLSLRAYTIPLSYYMYINSSDSNNVTILLDGGSTGTINLDSLVLKQELSQNIIITGDQITLTKNCTSGSTDCNTFIVTYRNLALNNDSVTFTIYNGTSEQLTYTETSSPNNFTYIFDATSLDFNADILTLRLVKIRDDGTEVTETIYFTPTGSVGFISPEIALFFSFLLFIGGISLVVARFLFGWFGLTIALAAVTMLSFSIGVWWIVFMQGVMIMMLLYIGINTVKQEGVF